MHVHIKVCVEYTMKSMNSLYCRWSKCSPHSEHLPHLKHNLKNETKHHRDRTEKWSSPENVIQTFFNDERNLEITPMISEMGIKGSYSDVLVEYDTQTTHCLTLQALLNENQYSINMPRLQNLQNDLPNSINHLN